MALGSEDAMDKDAEKDKTEVPALSLRGVNSDTTSTERGSIHYEEDNYDALSILDDDDAAVILQELACNFAVSNTTTPSRPSTVILSALAKSASKRGQSASPRSVLRTCLTKALMDASKQTRPTQPQFKRLLSAKRHHINDLSNDIVVLQKRIKELEEQNRLLVRISKRQELALKKYHSIESELPHVLEMHNVEIKMLQDKLRKATDLNKKDAETIKKYDAKLTKQNDELLSLRDLSHKKNLPEREQLTKKLALVQKELKVKQSENKELHRKLAILQRSLSQQVNAEIEKHKSISKKYSELKSVHQQTLEKLQSCMRELGSLQQYRFRHGRNLSSAFSSATNVSSSTETNTGGHSSSFGRRLTRKNVTRRIKATQTPPLSLQKPERCRTATLRKAQTVPCVFDVDGVTTVLNLDANKIGWASECKLSRNSNVEDSELNERRNSGSLPPLSGDIRMRAKSSESSCNLSSPETFGTRSKSNELQTSSVAIDESASRKTTIQSSWSDETREGEFTPLSASNSPATPYSKDDIVEEGNDVDDFFDEGPPQYTRSFSLIENYPPKERRKLHTSVDSDSSSHGTSSPSRDLEILTCSSHVENSSSVLRFCRGASAARRPSLKDEKSFSNVRAFSALSIEDRESSYTQTDPIN